MKHSNVLCQRRLVCLPLTPSPIPSPPLYDKTLFYSVVVVCAFSKVKTFKTVFDFLLWTQRKVKTQVKGKRYETLLRKATFTVEMVFT